MSSLDEFQSRYIDELLGAAGILDSIESAAQAEAWVSGAIAEWTALDGPPNGLEAAIDSESPLAAGLIRWMGGGPQPVGDQPWIADLGREAVGRVLRLSSPTNPDELGLIFEYVLDGEADHDVSVSITNGALTGIAIGPAGLADGIVDDPESDLDVAEFDERMARDAVNTSLRGSLEQLSPTSEANVPLLIRRFGGEQVASATTSTSRVLPERDAEDDAWCVNVVRSGLRKVIEADAPPSVADARAHLARLVEERNPDALTVLAVAGIEHEQLSNLDGFLDAVGGYFRPVDLDAHTDAQFDGLIELEPVDWAGVVLGLCRSPTNGPPLDGDSLVTCINRAPEITSTIPKSDAPRLAWAFEQMLFSWEVTGVINADGQITEAGRWLLPHAFVRGLLGDRDRPLSGDGHGRQDVSLGDREAET